MTFAAGEAYATCATYVRSVRNVRNALALCAVWCGRSMLWTFFTIGRLLVGLVDVSSDWETFSVSQSFKTSVFVSQTICPATPRSA